MNMKLFKSHLFRSLHSSLPTGISKNSNRFSAPIATPIVGRVVKPNDQDSLSFIGNFPQNKTLTRRDLTFFHLNHLLPSIYSIDTTGSILFPLRKEEQQIMWINHQVMEYSLPLFFITYSFAHSQNDRLTDYNPRRWTRTKNYYFITVTIKCDAQYRSTKRPSPSFSRQSILRVLALT